MISISKNKVGLGVTWALNVSAEGTLRLTLVTTLTCIYSTCQRSDLHWPSVVFLEKLDLLRCLIGRAEKKRTIISQHWSENPPDCFSSALHRPTFLCLSHFHANQWLSLFPVKTGCWAEVTTRCWPRIFTAHLTDRHWEKKTAALTSDLKSVCIYLDRLIRSAFSLVLADSHSGSRTHFDRQLRHSFQPVCLDDLVMSCGFGMMLLMGTSVQKKWCLDVSKWRLTGFLRDSSTSDSSAHLVSSSLIEAWWVGLFYHLLTEL